MNSLCSLAVTLAVAVGAEPPRADHPLETVMQDDAVMLNRPPAEVRRAARRMAGLGVDRVRLTASWSALAPASDRRRRPRFDATDSRAYPSEGFARLDRAVEEVAAAGMQTMIDIAFFAPRWAVPRASPNPERNVWRPSSREFGRFARAVAERYSGRFAARSGPLPAVRRWTTWNEPNHPVFLQPQWERSGGRTRPASPHHYRRLHNVAYDRLKAVSAENQVLIGGLASFGRPGRGPFDNIGPLRFTRELACVDSRLEPLRRAGCRSFRPLRADGFAHHPYSRDTAPDASDMGRDRVQIGELERLTELLRELHARGRIANALPLHLTEYGYETNPPDPRGRSPESHARYMAHAAYLAWSRRDVRSFPQFLLEDIGPDLSEPVTSAARWNDYQTGLFHHDGQPKRAVIQGFRLPFHAELVQADDGSRELIAFGEIRPGSGSETVALERLDPLEGWVPEPSLPAYAGPGTEGCGDFATDSHGFYQRRAAFRGPQIYRAVWRRDDGRTEASPPVTVADARSVPGGAAAALTPQP